ncbi:MAG: glycosyltransferase family 4 protein [Iamia sp.]
MDTAPIPSSVHLLTVLHSAERTGPPLLALQLLQWLRRTHPGWRTSTLFLDAAGELEPDFAALGPTLMAGRLAPFGMGRRRRRAVANAAAHAVLRRRLRAWGPIDVAHVHCAGSLRVLPGLPTRTVLGHLHELSVGLDLHLGPVARRYAADATRYVAVSDGVAEEFLSRVAVPPGRVERRHGFVDRSRLPTGPADRPARGLAADDLVVLSSGVRHWRKAPELFVRIARAAAERAPDVPWRFVWVGGQDASRLEDLVRQAGLDHLVRLLPHQSDPMGWLVAADIFLLPAREDAFPLVCVEAAAAGLPIVTFDNGGAAELVRMAGCGAVSPFPDVDDAADQLIDLARDPARRAALGRAGADHAHRHLLVDQAGPDLVATLVRTIEAGR